MNKVKDKLPALVDEELAAAMKEHPLFASAHEGYAVLLEEADEVRDELGMLNLGMSLLWDGVKRDNGVAIGSAATTITRAAINLAAEAIQVAAMARKIRTSIGAVEA